MLPTGTPSHLERAPELVLRWDSNGALTIKKFASSDEMVVGSRAALAFELLDRLARPSAVAPLLDGLARERAVPRAELQALLDDLHQRGLVQEPGSIAQDRYFALYSGLEIHRAMVFDHPRTRGFRDGIHQAVQDGDVVLDVGCGTGVLSCFAARSGARHVYAVDKAEIIELARQVVAQNGLSDRITLIRGDVQDIELPEPVDLIVSEWLGHFAVIENMLDAVLSARDRFLKPGGRMLPAAVDLYIAPLADAFLLGQLVDCWTRDLYGLDFTPVRTAALGQSAARPVDLRNLIAMPAKVHHMDMLEAAAGTMQFEGSARFTADMDARLDAVACHFTVDLAPGVVLDTGPAAPLTHWLQHVLPLEAIEVRRGDVVELALSSRPSDFPRRPEIGLQGQVLRQGERVAEIAPRVYL